MQLDNRAPLMASFFDHLFVHAWNHSRQDKPAAAESGLLVGTEIKDGQHTTRPIVIPEAILNQHIGIWGLSGNGKTALMKYFVLQNLAKDRHGLIPDRHHDLYSFQLRAFAAEEVRRQQDLSDRLILINPSDPDASVGINPLELTDIEQQFLQNGEIEEFLSAQFDLKQLGVRYGELLRHSLLVATANSGTLLDIRPMLTDDGFLVKCLKAVENEEVRAFFEERYLKLSEAMRRQIAEAVLNKLSLFSLDPRFRHLLGQSHSTFSLLDALDAGRSIGVDVDKGRTGQPGAITAGLLLMKFKHELFRRRQRTRYTLYADELPTLLALDSGAESLLSEARKFSISVISAAQYGHQFNAAMRAALLSVTTHICFALSGPDARAMAEIFDGGKHLEELLKNLPVRQFVAKIGHRPAVHGVVPELPKLLGDPNDLYERCRRRWARPRTEIEAEIQARYPQRTSTLTTKEPLDAWE